MWKRQDKVFSKGKIVAYVSYESSNNELFSAIIEIIHSKEIKIIIPNKITIEYPVVKIEANNSENLYLNVKKELNNMFETYELQNF